MENGCTWTSRLLQSSVNWTPIESNVSDASSDISDIKWSNEGVLALGLFLWPVCPCVSLCVSLRWHCCSYISWWDRGWHRPDSCSHPRDCCSTGAPSGTGLHTALPPPQTAGLQTAHTQKHVDTCNDASAVQARVKLRTASNQDTQIYIYIL